MIRPSDFVFTQGNLQDYRDCPYRFYLRYVLRTSWPALVVADAQAFELRGQAGGRFHRLIQQYLLGIPVERISAMVDEDAYPEMRSWWDGFITHVPAWLAGQSWAETTLTTQLAGQRLLAKYDLILAGEDGRLIVFDWKTSQKAPRKDWLLERIQTRLYRLVLFDAGASLLGASCIEPEQITMKYWYAAQPGATVDLPYSQAAYEGDVADLSAMIAAICSAGPEAFHRTDDVKRCRFCVYRGHCDRGVTAGDLEEFDGMDDELGEEHTWLDFEALPEIEF